MAWQAFRQYARSFGTGFVIGLPVYITITDLGFCIARVDGISMQPSLNPTNKESDVVLLNRWTARDVFNVKRGHVVSLISPSDPDVKLIKRVIGLEGDVIKTIGYKNRYVSIPKGHCWVEGDHRGKSYDSNKFGPISLGLVNGIASYIVWPPKRWMKIETKVEKDRMPMRRSFNQCAFGNILKSSKESDETSDGGKSSSKSSNADGSIDDLVAMKRKFLSEDIFLGSGTVVLSGEEHGSKTSSKSPNLTDSEMPKPDTDPNVNFNIVPEGDSQVDNDLEHKGNFGEDQNENRNDAYNRLRRNFEDKEIKRDLGIEQPSEALTRDKNCTLVNGETGSASAIEGVNERNRNWAQNTENESEVVVEIEIEGLS